MSVGADHHEIGAAVAVQVAEHHVAAASPRQPHRGCHLAERAVQVIAVRAIPGGRREQQIEVPVVVQVHEQGLGGARRVDHTRAHRDVLEPAGASVPVKTATPGGRDVQVEPSIVIEIAEGRRDGAIVERDAGFRRGLDEPAAPEVAPEQMPRDEHVLGLVVVVVAHREGHPALERPCETVGERLQPLEPASRRCVTEADRRRDGPRVL